MKIKMTKVFRGKIDGEYEVYMPGEKVEGKDAEYIAKNHPTWCEKIQEKKKPTKSKDD